MALTYEQKAALKLLNALGANLRFWKRKLETVRVEVAKAEEAFNDAVARCNRLKLNPSDNTKENLQ